MSAWSDSVAAKAPIAQYRKGEASSTTLVDSSGNGRNGTYVNGPVLGAAGLVDGDTDTAVTYDGTNDRAQVPYGSWMQGPFAEMTIEVIVKPSSVSGGTDLIVDRTNLGSNNDSNYQFYLKRIAGSTYGLLMRVGGSTKDLSGAPAGLAVAGERAILHGVYDGTAVRLHHQGVQVDSAAASGTMASGGALPLTIGSYSSTYAFPGVIDEVNWYDFAFTPEQCADHAYIALGVGTPPPTVSWLWAGALTDGGFSVAGRTSPGGYNTDVRVGVEVGATVTSPTDFGSTVTADSSGHFVATIAGLDPDTAYAYAVEIDGTLDTDAIGIATTLPAPGTPTSFTWAHASCAASGSDHRVFDGIATRNPLLFQYTGDLHYEDISTNNEALFLAAYDEVHTSARRSAMHRAVPIDYVPDDHDGPGGDNSDGADPAKAAMQSAYRKAIPHPPLPDADALYHSYQMGRVYFIVTDLRSERDPNGTTVGPTKTMMGATQKAWFKDELLAAESAGAALIVWVSSNVYNTDGTSGVNYDADSWASFTHERAELADYIRDEGLAEKVFVVVGDAHMLAYDDGTLSDFATGGGAPLPQFCAAALDQTGLVRGDNWSSGTFPGGGQFGLFTFTDDGTTLSWQWEGIDVDAITGAETVRIDVSGVVGAPAGITVYQWDGATLVPGTLLGRWNGAEIEPAVSLTQV